MNMFKQICSLGHHMSLEGGIQEGGRARALYSTCVLFILFPEHSFDLSGTTMHSKSQMGKS